MTTRRIRPGQRRHVDRLHRAAQGRCQFALHVLVAQRLRRPDRQVCDMPGETGGVILPCQPVTEARNHLVGSDPLGENISGEEIFLHELAQRGGELVLALDNQGRVRDGQAERAAEERRHREPVCDASDHGGLGASLDVAEESPVHARCRHREEQCSHRRQESGRAPAGGPQPPFPQFERFSFDRRDRRSLERRVRAHTAGLIWHPQSVDSAASDSAANQCGQSVRPATVRPATVRPATVRPATARPATARPASVWQHHWAAATTLRPGADAAINGRRSGSGRRLW